MFVHLNTHSIYSPMRGLLSLPEMMDLAKSCSMGTLALTDVNGLWGFIRFVQHCRSSRINPIAGVNLITSKQEVLILVENQHGYENLCRIISSMHDDPNGDISDILRKYHAGVFVLGYDISILKELSSFIPNSHLFVELRPGLQESTIKSISEELKLEIVATGDVYFKNKTFHKTHMALRAIDCNSILSDLNEFDYKSEDHWFRSEAEMVHLFPNSLHALNNSKYLADRCKTDWSFINTIFPSLSLKDRHQANKRLNHEVSIGAKKRYGHLNDEVRNRIEYELTIINQKGFSPYFLIVKDIVTQTRATIGRGSAAASIVSYCLFITQVDPIKYRLRFEGFIHPEREDMPDIDIDFCIEGRDNVIDYVKNKYGEKSVAQIGTIGTMAAKGVIRDVTRILDKPYGFGDKLAKLVPDTPGISLLEAIYGEVFIAKNGDVEIFYRDYGPIDGDPILLVQGLGGQLINWPPHLIEFLLDNGFRPIVFDNRDTGLSSRINSDSFSDDKRDETIVRSYIKYYLRLPIKPEYTIDDMAIDALMVLNSLGIDKSHLLGISMGGMIAQILASNNPDRIKTFTLIASTASTPSPLNGPSRKVRKLLLERTKNPNDSIEIRINRTRKIFKEIGYEGIDLNTEEFYKDIEESIERSKQGGSDDTGFGRQINAILGSKNRLDKVKSIDVPTLIIHGKEDPLIKVKNAYKMNNLINNSKLKVISDFNDQIKKLNEFLFLSLIGNKLSLLLQ